MIGIFILGVIVGAAGMIISEILNIGIVGGITKWF